MSSFLLYLVLYISILFNLIIGSTHFESSSKIAVEFNITGKLVRNEVPIRNNTLANGKYVNQLFGVDLFVVFDFSLYTAWRSRWPGDQQQSKKQTIKAMREYAMFFVRSIDASFKILRDRGINLHVHLCDTFVSTTPGNSSWTEKTLFTEKRNHLYNSANITKAWMMFVDWMKRHKQPKCDHAILLTARNLTKFTKNDVFQRQVGLTKLGAICEANSASIVQNWVDSKGILVAAHELGHSIGARHDGDLNSCDPKRGHIMAPTANFSSTNNWKFSECTIDQIREKVRSHENDCLLKQRYKVNRITLQPVELGQKYSLDEQCILVFGKGSYVCRELHFGHDERTRADLCRTVWCAVPDQPTRCRAIVPFDQSTCSSKTPSVCVLGECRPKNDSSLLDMECPLGDSPRVRHDKSCHDIITEKTSNVCYSVIFKSICCAQCANRSGTVTNCRWGDRNRQCAQRINASRYLCYENELVCCQSCAGVKNSSQPGCEYGDRNVTACARLWPGECYDTRTSHVCCSVCLGHVREHHSCWYGDRWKDCKKMRCNVSKYANMCCKTCETGTFPLDHISDMHYDEGPSGSFGALNIANGCHDSAPWCKVIKTRRHLCYVAANYKTCCAVCSLSNSTNDCPYGDKLPKSCLQMVHQPLLCYKYQATCCETCSRLNNRKTPHCPYGCRYEYQTATNSCSNLFSLYLMGIVTAKIVITVQRCIYR